MLNCSSSTNSSDDKISLSGTWYLELITDDNNLKVRGPEGLEGSIGAMVLENDGTGNVYVIPTLMTMPENCTWQTSPNQLIINVDNRSELSHRFELWFEGEQVTDNPPSGTSLLLYENNQFTSNITIPLTFYYLKE